MGEHAVCRQGEGERPTAPSTLAQRPLYVSNTPSLSLKQSVSALSATKRDLAEFVSVLSNDTSSAVQNASDNIRSLIQQETVNRTPPLISHLHTHTLSLSLSLAHSITHILSHTLTHAHTHTLSLSLSLAHSITHILSHTHSHTHTHSLTHTLSHTLSKQHTQSEEEAKHSKSPLSHPPSSTSVTLTPAHPPGVPYDRSQAQLFALQSSSDTFLSDPHGKLTTVFLYT